MIFSDLKNEKSIEIKGVGRYLTALENNVN
jgi:hypothetical protein